MPSLNLKRLLKIAAFIIIFCVITGYSYYQSRNLMAGPKLEIESPVNGAVMASSTALVTGKTQNISYVTLNGRQIFTDESGNFSMNILLLKGYNTVTVSAKDKFGRSISKSIQLIYK